MKSMYTRTFGAAVMLSALISSPLPGQAPADQVDPMVKNVQAGAKHIQWLFTVAAEDMTDPDYEFKPTPEVRSFGQLLAHVAETNYSFCATATGQVPPVAEVEKTTTIRTEIQRVLADSFEYCDKVFATMSNAENAGATRMYNGRPLPALALLNYRNYHSLLHWGNAITYMRLRGKVPPSA